MPFLFQNRTNNNARPLLSVFLRFFFVDARNPHLVSRRYYQVGSKATMMAMAIRDKTKRESGKQKLVVDFIPRYKMKR